MKIRFPVVLVACFIAMFGTTALAANDWPSKPVRILVSFPPGGASDLAARLLSSYLSDKFDEQFVVVNKPGAGGTIAAVTLQREKADGYTFMLSNLAPYSIAPTFFEDLSYDAMKDFTHVSYIGAVNLGLFVSPELGISDLNGFVEMARAKPGSIEIGYGAIGSWGQVIGDRFQRLAKVDLVVIPYKGAGPMRLDFLAGVIPTMIDALPQNIPSMQDGTTVAIAVSSKKRLASAPDVMTFSEQGYNIVAENWLGLTAPAGLDPSIVSRIDSALAEIIALEEVQQQFAIWGLEYERKTSEEFTAYVAEQIEVWRPLVIDAVGSK